MKSPIGGTVAFTRRKFKYRGPYGLCAILGASSPSLANSGNVWCQKCSKVVRVYDDLMALRAVTTITNETLSAVFTRVTPSPMAA